MEGQKGLAPSPVTPTSRAEFGAVQSMYDISPQVKVTDTYRSIYDAPMLSSGSESK